MSLSGTRLQEVSRTSDVVTIKVAAKAIGNHVSISTHACSLHTCSIRNEERSLRNETAKTYLCHESPVDCIADGRTARLRCNVEIVERGCSRCVSRQRRIRIRRNVQRRYQRDDISPRPTQRFSRCFFRQHEPRDQRLRSTKRFSEPHNPSTGRPDSQRRLCSCSRPDFGFLEHCLEHERERVQQRGSRAPRELWNRS